MRLVVLLSSTVAILVLLGCGIAFFVGIPAPVSEVHKVLPHEQFRQG
ncbi:MAG: hypothetical protein LBH38_03125 [Holosporales bacterium]|nr:hypothetical protein [Holosporales bacterium]